MGLTVNICGRFSCLKCGATNSTCIQTKLLEATRVNCDQFYGAGGLVTIVGLADYSPLFPRTHGECLQIAIGEWDCRVCSLNYQWALVSFEVLNEADPIEKLHVRINSVDGFVPDTHQAFTNVNFISDELVMLASFPDLPTVSSLQVFERLSADEKINRIINGHKRWQRDVVFT